nr:hypothetical protein [Tanacetum cinerariifolium]
MTYSMLLKFVGKRFNLDPNVRFNLSFNLPVIERDITNDDAVECFFDCATNSITEEIPHLYILPPKVEARIIPGPLGTLQKALARKKANVQAGGRDNIFTTQEYVRKVNEDVSEDDHFMQGPWLQAIVYLHGEGIIVSGCLGDMKKHCIKRKLELVVGVVKSCTLNLLGDMTVTLKDPTGTMGGTIHYKVFQNENDGNNPYIVPEITTTTQTLISSKNHQVDIYDECEQALDIDDSDLRLTPIICPNNNPHIVPEITTTTQTLFSSQNNQVVTYVMKPIRIITSLVVIVQTAKLYKLDDTREGREEFVMSTQEILTGCFGDVKKFLKNEKLEKVVAVIKSGTPNALGNLTVTLKDLSGTIFDTIHYNVRIEERFTKDITVGATLILHNVSVFSPKQSSHHYLNITKKNMVKVFHNDGGSA